MAQPPVTNTITVGTDTVQLVPRVSKRRGLVLCNSGTVDALIACTFEDVPGAAYTLVGGDKLSTVIMEAFYAATASGTTTISYIDDRGD